VRDLNANLPFSLVPGRMAGFTMIELILVILLIGILAAVALPQFVNLTIQAKNAANQSLAGTLTSALHMAQAAWLAHGSVDSTGGATIILQNTEVHVNSLGWPDNNKNVSPLATDCAVIWKNLLSQAPIAGCASGCSQVCTTISTSGCYVATASGPICMWTNSSNLLVSITYNLSDGVVGTTSE
jgi:prepilin-type N-terminal cleavage/methylation domain-containing protein